MSTRSRIGMVMADGSVKSIYCHWDGYPSNNGELLLYHYSNKEKVEELISLGDISSLDRRVAPVPNKTHSFDNPQDGVTVAYIRDRNENPANCSAREDASVDEFIRSDIEEWGYLFEDGKWFVIDGHDAPEDRTKEELTQEYIDRE